MQYILGLDIAKDKVDVVLRFPNSQSEYAQFENNQGGFKKLWRFLKKRKAISVHACMEATGTYYEKVAQFLAEKQVKVSVVNPARIKAYAMSQMARNKTDKIDATLIAHFCETQSPPTWIPPTTECQELRMLVRHLEDIQDDLQRHRNRLHAYERVASTHQIVLDNLSAQIQFTDLFR